MDRAPENHDRLGMLSHDLPCPVCGHPAHTYLPCSDSCDCKGAPT